MNKEVTKEYSIFKTDTIKDRNRIITFWRDNFPGWPEAKFDLFYLNNPFGKSECWLVKHNSQNKIVGANALFPRNVYVKGKTLLAGLSGDLGVDTEHHRKGLALKLRKELIDYYLNSSIDFLYATPNEKSAGVLRKVEYTFIGKIQRFVKILRAYNHIQRRIKIKWLALAISYVIDFILLCFDNSFGFKRDRIKLETEFPKSFDKRFDELWQNACINRSIIFGERSQKALEWRFSCNSYKKFQICAITEKKHSTLIGYIIFRVCKNNVYINDLFTINNDIYLKSTLIYFTRFCREKKYDSIAINFFGNKLVVQAISNSRFIVRGGNINVAIYTKRDLEGKEIILDKDNWYLFDMDNDTEA